MFGGGYFRTFFRLLGCSKITAVDLGGYDVVNVVDLVKAREAEREVVPFLVGAVACKGCVAYLVAHYTAGNAAA